MKHEYKVEADIGDEHGGGYYHIGTFCSVSLALIFIEGLRIFFGRDMKIMYDTLGVGSKDADLTFKGVKLTTKDNKTIDEFY